MTISPTLGQYYWDTAGSVASAVDPAKLLPCAPANADDEACVRRMTGALGRRLWRRPLVTSEVDDIIATYRTVRGSSDGAAGVRAVVKRLLLSPSFLFRTEIGAPDPAMSGRRILSAHEVATELSYLLWDQPPDEALAAAADDGSLLAPGRLESELARMLRAETPVKGKLSRTFQNWLGIEDIAEADKDRSLFPLFSPALMSALALETRTLIDEVLWKGDGSLRSLLEAPYTYANATSGKLYGQALTGTAMQRITPNPDQRLGLLTQPSLWAAHAEPNQTGISRRGEFLAREVLCIALPEPPADVASTSAFENFQKLSMDKGLTIRQKWERFGQQSPECGACHNLFVPAGLTFENYDALGVYRTKDESGRSIDASGDVVLALGAPPVRVADGVDFARKLAARTEAYRCFARHLFRASFGRDEAAADGCALESMDRAFAASGYKVAALIGAIVSSDGFRFRGN